MGFIVEEFGDFTSQVVENHVSYVKARLSVLDLIIDPERVVLDDIIGHELSQLLLPVHIATFFFAFLKRWRNDLLTHLILLRLRCIRKWSEVSTSSHAHPFCDLFAGFNEYFLGLRFSLNLLDDTGAFAPWHGLTFVLVRASYVECLIQRLKQSIVVHVIDVFHLFLGN